MNSNDFQILILERELKSAREETDMVLETMNDNDPAVYGGRNSDGTYTAYDFRPGKETFRNFDTEYKAKQFVFLVKLAVENGVDA